MQNFAAIRSTFLEKMMFEVAIFSYFPDIPKLKLPLPPYHMGSQLWLGVEVGLQSYRSFTFCKCNTRGEMQFSIELATTYTLANHDEINSKTRHVFVKHGCPRRQQSQNMAKISKSYILTQPHPPGACHVSEVWGTHRWTYSSSLVTSSSPKLNIALFL